MTEKEKKAIYDKEYYKKNKIKKNKQSRDNFYKNEDRYKATAKKWATANRVKMNSATQRSYYKNHELNKMKARGRNKDSIRSATFKFKYGITLNDYNELFTKQNGCCLICNRHQVELKKRKLAVDHCHVTGKIRGLLCNNCNLLIGHSKENITTLQNAIGYLKKHSEWV